MPSSSLGGSTFWCTMKGCLLEGGDRKKRFLCVSFVDATTPLLESCESCPSIHNVRFVRIRQVNFSCHIDVANRLFLVVPLQQTGKFHRHGLHGVMCEKGGHHVSKFPTVTWCISAENSRNERPATPRCATVRRGSNVVRDPVRRRGARLGLYGAPPLPPAGVQRTVEVPLPHVHG